ncbi:MAG: hypothetical protein JO348_10060 [Alphaproteobacteria bacterium]|nr:hypothetical protein [Alphaproteobacteria bacterium]MBV9540001.1 hypothetical protein [Alphaproteobacteria bacterium]MBV9904278.1 hypothetical protein [Alphaproteobacteria bacterium]
MRKIWAVGALLCWTVGGQAAGSLLNPAWGVLFPAATAVQLAHQCSRPAPSPMTGVWQPSAAQIAAMEPRLSAYLASQLTAYTKDKFAAANYYRQYGGLLINGHAVIYVNGLYRSVIVTDPGKDWRTQPFLICDGGILAFGVEYDPANGQFSHFAFNGHL